MDSLNDAAKNFDATVTNWLSFLDNEYISGALIIFLIVYASYAAPKLPPYILKLFDNPLFKLLIFFLIVYSAKKNPTVAIIAAVGLMVTIHALNKLKLDQMLMRAVKRENMDDLAMMQQPRRLMVEDAYSSEEMIPESAVAAISEEVKSQPGCVKKLKYRNEFYPQYVNLNPEAYMARYNGKDVDGYDVNADYVKFDI